MRFKQHYLLYPLCIISNIIFLDKQGEKLVEVDHKFSNFIEHNHPMELVDYIACWKIDMQENKLYKLKIQECVFTMKKLVCNGKKLYNRVKIYKKKYINIKE